MKFKEVPNIKRHIDTYLANFRNCVVHRKLHVVVNREISEIVYTLLYLDYNN